MRKSVVLVLLMLAAAGAFAGDKKEKNKDFKSAKLLKVQTTDLQAANYAITDNRNDPIGQPNQSPGGMTNMTGGAFSSAPAHFIRYTALIETESEVIQISKDREVTMNQPDLKVGSEILWKPNGNKQVEIIDGHGKKFEMLVVKRVAKGEAVPEMNAPPANSQTPKR